MNYENFLNHQEKDFKGRTLNDIWKFSDQEIENNHDFIQIIFPLNKPSQSVSHGHYLHNEEEINKIKQNENIQKNIIKSSLWFLSFLKRNHQWKNKYDHNQLRITRIIKSLRLLVSDNEADRFYKSILELLGNAKVNNTTLEFWKNA